MASVPRGLAREVTCPSWFAGQWVWRPGEPGALGQLLVACTAGCNALGEKQQLELGWHCHRPARASTESAPGP